MDDRFFHSFLPPVAKVCGRKLGTFSLWHHFLLSAVGSPIALGGEKIGIADLLVAVRICRLKFGEVKVRPSILDAWWGWKLRRDLVLFRREAGNFYEWIAKQCSPPKFYRAGLAGGINKGVESAPRCLGLVCSLMSRGGMTEQQAWDCNLGRAMWMDAQFAQLNGVDLRFLDDEDLDDSEIDLSTLTDEQAMEKFQRDLPEELVGSTYEHWRAKIKKGGSQ